MLGVRAAYAVFCYSSPATVPARSQFALGVFSCKGKTGKPHFPRPAVHIRAAPCLKPSAQVQLCQERLERLARADEARGLVGQVVLVTVYVFIFFFGGGGGTWGTYRISRKEKGTHHFSLGLLGKSA